MKVKSGGQIPALLAVGMFQTLSECYNLGWAVEFQGINVADKASGAVGDITIRKDDTVVLGVEVTERPIDQGRVTLIFDQKILPSNLIDYLFLVTSEPHIGALSAARNYTAVGHEMNFVHLDGWIVHNLATIGPACRLLFQTNMVRLLGTVGISAALKVAWNARMAAAIAGQTD